MSAPANIDLRKSTFLDFTSDNRVIEQVLGASDDLAVELFREELSENTRALSFVFYATATGDKHLLSRIEKEFADELAFLSNE